MNAAKKGGAMKATRILLSAAIAIAAGVASAAAASDRSDVMAVVNQFNDSLNKGDVPTAVATCASPVSIVDEFPPHAWQGADACTEWANAFAAYNEKNRITDPRVTLSKPWHVDITGDRAYVVVPATYTYKQNGKRVKESGSILTVALQKGSAGWRMSGWAWAKR
jgi:ketosteroid isomerase-like protein